MTHLYIITRGIKNEVDASIRDLQAQYFPYKMKGKDKFIQLGVRPVQLWEIAMPKDYLQETMRTLWDDKQPTARLKTATLALRKILKAKKIPQLDPKGMKRLISKDNVVFYPIGIREDKIDEDGTERI